MFDFTDYRIKNWYLLLYGVSAGNITVINTFLKSS